MKDRERWEEALRESEERYRFLLESVTDGVCVLDREWRYTIVNKAMERFAQMPRESLLGNRPMDVFPGIEETAVFKVFRGVMETRKPHAVLDEYTFPNGCKGWYEVRVYPVSEGILCISTDTTERKRTEEARRESEEKYRATFESTGTATIIVEEDKTISLANTEFVRLCGYSKEEVESKKRWTEFVAKDDLERMKEYHRVGRIDADTPPRNYEFHFVDRHAEVRDILLTVAMIPTTKKSVVSLLDITERKKAEGALKESERRYEELFCSVMEGIAIVDEKGIVRFCNPAYAEIFEKESVEDMIGECNSKNIPEDQKDLWLSQIEERKKGVRSQYELTILTAKGNRKTVHLSVSPRFDDDGNYVGSFSAIIDITETKELQELAERARRLEAAGRIAGQVAHDFNNLLGPLVAYPAFIRDELPEDHPVLPLVKDMETAAEQMSEINQQLFTLGRRGHYQHEPLNMNETVQQVLSKVKSATDSLVMEADLCEDLMNVKGGPSQIYRMVSNLVDNAVDAMKNTGRLTIKTENCYVETVAAEYGSVPQGEYVRLTVSDTGCGIPDGIQHKIFDPFFTTKTTDKKRGSGLGLSVVDAVLKDHGGHIDLESSVGEGTSFFVYLPMTRELIDTTEMEETIGGTESILVVDDDAMQCEVMVRLLNGLGYSAAAVGNGEEAIELLKEKPHDLLLLDMIMPLGIDGTETYRRALELNPSQRAIIVSGYSETERVREALRLGAGAYMRKPLTLRALAVALREELDRVVV